MKKPVIALSAFLLLAGCSEEAAPPAPENEQQASEATKTAPESDQPGAPPAPGNELKEVNGVPVIQNPDNLLVLVNKEFALPSDYTPPDLVRPNVRYSFGDQDIEKSYIRKEAATALESMFKAAEADNIMLFAVSGYRSYSRQEDILAASAAEKGEEEALKSIAPPGMSEHQSGLAMDISSESNGFDLTQSFESTAEGQWLAAHAHEYGFILRYPKSKEAITQYIYEPWHFRYVGEEAAAAIFKENITLEEYMGETPGT